MYKLQNEKIAEILERRGALVGYLFGSAARGEMGPHSDIDVAVLFDEEKVPQEKQFDAKLDIASEIAESSGVERVDVINLSTTSDPLIKYIAAFSGVLFFEKNKERRLTLERSIVREYENTRSLRRIAETVMKNQIRNGAFGKARNI